MWSRAIKPYYVFRRGLLFAERNEQIRFTTHQSMINAQLSEQMFLPWCETELIKTIPMITQTPQAMTFVCFKSTTPFLVDFKVYHPK